MQLYCYTFDSGISLISIILWLWELAASPNSTAPSNKGVTTSSDNGVTALSDNGVTAPSNNGVIALSDDGVPARSDNGVTARSVNGVHASSRLLFLLVLAAIDSDDGGANSMVSGKDFFGLGGSGVAIYSMLVATGGGFLGFRFCLMKKDVNTVKPVLSDHIIQDIFLAFQTGGCLLLHESSAESCRSFLHYFHSATSNHLSIGISMYSEWMVT